MRDEAGDGVLAGQAGRHGVAGLDGVQPGSSPRTSLLHPSLVQPWGDLSQTLPWVGPWTAKGEKSRGGMWLGAPAAGGGGAAPLTPPPLSLRSPLWIPPCQTPEKCFPTEEQEGQGLGTVPFFTNGGISCSSACTELGEGEMKPHQGHRT